MAYPTMSGGGLSCWPTWAMLVRLIPLLHAVNLSRSPRDGGMCMKMMHVLRWSGRSVRGGRVLNSRRARAQPAGREEVGAHHHVQEQHHHVETAHAERHPDCERLLQSDILQACMAGAAFSW
jgi:hypothetical protein